MYVTPVDLPTLLNHLFNFAAPALGLALWLTLVARFLGPKPAAGLAWWAQAAINTVVGCAVLVAGLWAWGRDGKMLTYGALVLAMASAQALMRRG